MASDEPLNWPDRLKKETHTLGPIIHNPQVVGRLAEQGVSPVDSLDEVDKGAVVLIRSHGVGPEVYEQAENRELKVIDATCPHVKKAQQDAKNIIEKGEKLIIVGEKAHPEVISISQWGANRGYYNRQGRRGSTDSLLRFYGSRRPNDVLSRAIQAYRRYPATKD